MSPSVPQREAIKRRRREQEAARLGDGPLRPRVSSQLTSLPGETFEDIFRKEQPMAGNMAVREIPLGGGHLLKLDRADGLYRAAYYWTPPGGAPGSKRQAAAKASLTDVLTTVFGEASGEPGAADLDPATVEHYIRSTSWGAGLP